MRRGIACLLAALVALTDVPALDAAEINPSVTAAPVEPDGLAAGRRMYREGLLPNGQPMRASVLGNVPVSGSQVTCLSCHRRSGLGSIEGNVVVPALAGSILFNPGEQGARDISGPLPEGSSVRPPYTDEGVARAIREGIDSAGRRIDSVMPRYDLGDTEMGRLIAYLKSLSDSASPGVDETTIHFATVIAGPVDPVRRRAVLGVLEAYFKDLSGGTRNEQGRAERGSRYRERHDRAYRQWQLHVWELNGDPDTWTAQLETYYRAQPVFALLGGIGEGEWRPIHRFCSQQEVPCLLPHTDVPVIAPGDFYNVYYSKGLVIEAQVLAKFLLASGAADAGQTLVQVYRPTLRGATPAETLRTALQDRGFNGLVDVPLDGAAPGADFWTDLAARYGPSRLILWLDESDLQDIGALVGMTPGPAGVYLSASLMRETWQALPPALGSRIYLTDRYDVPRKAGQVFRRTQAWLRAKAIEPTDLSLQAETLGAALVAADAVRHLLGRFSREYFLELIEHRMDRVATDTAYPRLSLAPGQRFASKGAYIVQPSPIPGKGLVRLGDWIVP